MIIDELVAVLGFETKGEGDLRRFEAGMAGALSKAKTFAVGIAAAGAAVAAGVAAVGGGMFALAKDAAGPLDDMVKAADRAGVAFEAFQELNFVAAQSGASTSELGTSLQSMGRQLAEAARGTGRAKLALEDYGISATDATGQVKDTVSFLGEIADKMQGLSDQQALDLGTKLGMSPAMVTMLKSGNSEIEKLRKQSRDAGLVFSEKDARNAEAFNDQLSLFTKSITAMKHRLGVQFLPVLQGAISGVQNWINANQTVIQQNIELWGGRIVSGVTAAVESLARFARAIVAVGEALGGIVNFLSGGSLDPSALQALGIAAGVLFAAIAPMAAAVIAAYLAIDDFLSYLEGGESVIGDFIEYFKGIGEEILSIDWAGIGASMMSSLWEGMKSIGGAIKDWFMSLVPDWAVKFLGGSSAPSGTTDSPNIDEFSGVDHTPTQEKLSNFKGNMDKISGSNAATAAMNDNRVQTDSRNQSVTVNSNVTQNVQQATQAPMMAAQAVSAAVGQAAVQQRAQINTEAAY